MSLLPTSAAPLAIAPTAAKPRRLDFEVVIAGAGMVGLHRRQGVREK